MRCGSRVHQTSYHGCDAGNRFYQSLGNIQVDPRIALLFVCFDSGDALYISGVARNLFGEEAVAMMPRARLLTHVRVGAAVLISGAISLALDGHESLSPYNPPVRYLARELAAPLSRPVSSTGESGDCTATLVAVRGVCDGVRRFTFELSPPLTIAPGAHVILDFSAQFDTQYRHMNDARPRSLNEDYVRAWTVSSSPPVQAATSCTASGEFGPAATIDCTIRRVEGGLISSALHSLPLAEPPALKLRVRSVCSSFSCFEGGSAMQDVRRPMLWLSGGVGLTPFLSMHRALVESGSTVDVVWLVSCRAADVALIVGAISAPPLLPSLCLRVFLTSCDEASAFTAAAAVEAAAAAAARKLRVVVCRRLAEPDVAAVVNVSRRMAFISAPHGLASGASAWCVNAGIAPEDIRKEAFVY